MTNEEKLNAVKTMRDEFQVEADRLQTEQDDNSAEREDEPEVEEIDNQERIDNLDGAVAYADDFISAIEALLG